jgi:hypothetical protein
MTSVATNPVLGAIAPAGKPRSASLSSESSSNSPITYTEEATPAVRTTIQGKDWRKPSTFHLKAFKDQTLAEKICDLATCPASMHELKDAELDRGPVTTQSILGENVFILSRALIPIVVQGLAYQAFPSKFPFCRDCETLADQISPADYKWPIGLAYPFYLLSFVSFALMVLNRMTCKSPNTICDFHD